MELICDGCGRQFEGRAGAKYCSGRCRTKAYRDRQAPPVSTRQKQPITDAIRNVTMDLTRQANRLDKLTAEPRFKRRARDLEKYRKDVVRARDLLTEVIDRWPTVTSS